MNVQYPRDWLHGGGRIERDGFSGGVDRDHRDFSMRDRNGFAGAEAFGFNFDTDRDALGALTDCCCEEVHDVTHVDGGFELNAVERGGDPAVCPVAAGFDEARLVDVAEDDAAEDRAVVVGVAGKGGDAECERTVAGLPGEL